MSLKMEYYSEFNVTQNRLSLQVKCHSKWNDTQSGTSRKRGFHSRWNVPQNELSLKIKKKSPKLECHSNLDVLKLEYH